MMFDLSKTFALPNTLLKSKNYCTGNFTSMQVLPCITVKEFLLQLQPWVGRWSIMGKILSTRLKNDPLEVAGGARKPSHTRILSSQKWVSRCSALHTAELAWSGGYQNFPFYGMCHVYSMFSKSSDKSERQRLLDISMRKSMELADILLSVSLYADFI